MMKQIRATVVSKAAVQYQGVTTSTGPVRLRPGRGGGGAGPAPVRASVQDMITQISATHQISDDEALYIRQVTEEKIADATSEIKQVLSNWKEDYEFYLNMYDDTT